MSVSDLGARLVVALFSLAFALVFTFGGAWAGVAPIYVQLHGSWEANRYLPVQALVESARTSKKSGTTYRAKADFSYEMNGQTYRGDRISFDFKGTAYSGHGYEHAVYEKLNSARIFRRPVRLWVDPDPDRSVYDRSIHWDRMITNVVLAILFIPLALYAWRIFFRVWRV